MLALEDFVDAVSRSGLVPRSDLAAFRAGLEASVGGEASVDLARRLVRQGLLTGYQARKLLAGATRGFFLGGYRILRPLGEGGMGKVYLAVNHKNEERVAIKVLPPRKALEEAGSLPRFRREMELSQRCVHPNVARTLAVGNEGDVYFMVLEYIPGMSLYDMVRSDRYGPLRVTDAAKLFLRVIDGLAAAHRAGLVHRDIKPSNIMITPDGNAKILDLGLARALGEEKGITRANTVLGTLDYASPEQLSDATKADVRSDLYSLGCTIYYALSGRPPFEGGDMINKIFRQRLDDPEPLEKAARGVPAAFAAIVRKLMSKKPEERYQTCEELRADMARWTDPDRVHAILGAEADAARSFRPPAPALAEEDLLLLSLSDESESGFASLRDLGDPEPSNAPRHKAPLPPLAAARRPLPAARPRQESVDDLRWLFHFCLVAMGLGLLAILIIAVALRG
ncbi:Serine/threonine-protein kinase PrkC [Aquisphaera giovannonii]|uniref:non-specific serine/threonine protein kinase n=1 Tax=Aquisphaera giovannonii TaxID=406548 RepID=A0A5B9W1C7_9BACT|nr:serine/threonine-protein kinase [Aquisphaera giovannonii]QEH34001.1 Serine/threonine-protein kinase PrkC [Aquisphaera giovannonii]